MHATLLRWSLITIALVCGQGITFGQEDENKPTADAGPTIGDSCTVRAERNGAREQFRGDVVQVNEDWIALHCVSEGRHEHGVPVLAKAPLVGRFFKNSSIGRIDEIVWIPRDAATISERKPTADEAKAEVVADSAPPEHQTCTVRVVHDGKVIGRQGGVESMNDSELTMSMPVKVRAKRSNPTSLASFVALASSFDIDPYETRYMQVRIKRPDILCVKMPNSPSPAE